MIFYRDPKYNFIEFFNPENGFLIRSDVTNTPNSNPLQRSFPELIDIGIMGTCHISHLNICKNAGVDCYQMAKKSSKKNMSLDDFKTIATQSEGKAFQFALGGAGDPNKHEDFKDILKISYDSNIIPNLTTSGMFIRDDEIHAMEKYCGAVAVSFYTRLIEKNGKIKESNPQTFEAINSLVSAGLQVNVHYVLSRSSIDEAIIRLRNNLFPKNINAIVFIFYKPVGYGKQDNVLNICDSSFIEFLKLVDTRVNQQKIGFDTCSTPALLNKCKHISKHSLDFCEAARFSMYINSDLDAYPCSFDCIGGNYKYSLREKNILDAWESKTFQSFRKKQDESCDHCELKIDCLGGCVLPFSLNLCGKKNK